MGISVKNFEAEAEIRYLAERLGVGLTEAIQLAVKAKMAELDAQKLADFDRRMAAIKRLQEELRPFRKDGATSNCDDLYDQDGLPA
jgi:antitoxin VapB